MATCSFVMLLRFQEFKGYLVSGKMLSWKNQKVQKPRDTKLMEDIN